MSGPIDVDVDFNTDDIFDFDAFEQAMEASLIAGALLIANEWKRRAPYRTGTYRRSIHVAGHPELTPDFEGPSLAPDREPLTVKMGTAIIDPPYPIFLEYGTSRMPPKPSRGPALRAKKKAAFDEVSKALEELIGKGKAGTR